MANLLPPVILLKHEELAYESNSEDQSSWVHHHKGRAPSPPALPPLPDDLKAIKNKSSLWSKPWKMYNDTQPEQDSLNRHIPSSKRSTSTVQLESLPELPKKPKPIRQQQLQLQQQQHQHQHHQEPPSVDNSRNSITSTLLRILKRKHTVEMTESGDPFRHLWVTLSSLYGQALVVLVLACCVIEVMDNAVRLFSFQGFLMLYLFIGSIAVILCIYVWVLIDSCGSLSTSSSTREYDSEDDSPGNDDVETPGPLTRFGSLKRVHRSSTSGTSFYIRVGAIVFGLATLVYSGLEVAMHTTMEAHGNSPCLNDIVFIHPVLHGLFTFLQMHFLFVNSQVVVERFGVPARFGFMHLAATNIALWVRMIVWESGTEWAFAVNQAQQRGTAAASYLPSPLELKGFPKAEPLYGSQWVKNNSHHVSIIPLSAEHISQVIGLHECLNSNSLGQLWTASSPYLAPFIIQFSIISAAVTVVMGFKVGNKRVLFKSSEKSCGSSSSPSCRVVDCHASSRGLFLGLLCAVAGIVVIIVFFVVRADETFPVHLPFWLAHGTQTALLAVAAALSLVGVAQVGRMTISSFEPSRLDNLLEWISSAGVIIYSIFGISAGVGRILEMLRTDAPEDGRAVALIATSALQIIHVSIQNGMVSEVTRRHCSSRQQLLNRPGRQIVTCLLCLNGVMWLFDSLVTFSWISQQLQLEFFGVLCWGVISRISLPLLVLHRFHSCVRLLNSWQKSYN